MSDGEEFGNIQPPVAPGQPTAPVPASSPPIPATAPTPGAPPPQYTPPVVTPQTSSPQTSSQYGPPPGAVAPPTGALPPGHPSSMPPAAEKKRSLWKWIIGLLLLLVVGVGGCTAGLAYWGFSALGAPVDASNEFLALLDEAQAGAAYDSLAPQCKLGERSDFVTAFSGLDIGDYDLNTSSIHTSNGLTTATASGTATVAGVSETTKIDLVKVADEWKVCSFQLGQISG